MHITAVLNRDGGTLRTLDLDGFQTEAKAVFARHGHVLDCVVVGKRQVEKQLRKAATDERIDVVLAAGGDGTVSSAAAIAFENGKPLAILPVGTMNLFARALQMPLTLPEALDAVAGGQIGLVDIATANGRPFVHQYGVGTHARLVRIREGMTYSSRVGKMVASLRAIGAAAWRPPEFDAKFRTGTQSERQRVSGIAVSNNPLGDGHIPHADSLDAGVLGIYIAAPLSTMALIRLAFDVLRGTWRDSDAVTEIEAAEVTLDFPKPKRGARAVLDGELIKLDRSVTLRVHPGGLKVLLPKMPIQIDNDI